MPKLLPTSLVNRIMNRPPWLARIWDIYKVTIPHPDVNGDSVEIEELVKTITENSPIRACAIARELGHPHIRIRERGW